jgi:polysaccharide export outer membrane protein
MILFGRSRVFRHLLAPSALLICAGTLLAPGTALSSELLQAAQDVNIAAKTTGAQNESSSLPSDSELLIGSGDLLEVSVLGAPDYVKQVRVSADGWITLPLIGPVKVLGISVSQAERIVADRLSEGAFFNNPQVSVMEKEFATQGITVLGEVQKPAIYPLQGKRTLFDAISAAGGTSPKAGKTAVVIHRAHPQAPETIDLSYDVTGSPRANVSLLPGDTIVVSKAGMVYVVGDVRTPTGIIMENPNLTVLQAIAMAQGTNSSASLDNAKLIRKTPHGPDETPFSLKKIIAAKAPDFKLEADDIVFVPTSAAKILGKRSLEAAVQAATAVLIYRPF